MMGFRKIGGELGKLLILLKIYSIYNFKTFYHYILIYSYYL